LKLAIALFRYFPHGGLQRDCLRIAEALAHRGHAVTLICGTWQGPHPAGLDLRILGRHGSTNHGADTAFARAAVALARSLRVDATIGFNRMPGLDICYSAENSFKAKAAEARSALYRVLPRTRAYCRLEQAVFGGESETELLLLSPMQLESYRRHYDFDPARAHLMPPAIMRDRVRASGAGAIRTAVRGELSLSDEHCALLALGSGFRTKGLDRTLRAMAAIPGAARQRLRLLVVGSGKAASMAALARRLGIARQVRFLGPRDDVPRLLLGADLLAHPARDECTGTVILEAVVAGLPVLCTANCGYGEHVLRAGAGIVLQEPFELDAMTRELAGMLDRRRLAGWSQSGVRYGQTADLYRGIEVAADTIEMILRRR
jgi:UDP-glucose:(heptosyl)LPS alpha-1,3-glucosyltransferase